MNKHCAYNITTGEIIVAPTGNILKKRVAFSNRISRELGASNGHWRFGHKGLNNLCDLHSAKGVEVLC
jgi:hypothetical protein